MRNKRYFHLKTGKPYELITDNHMVKLNGEWIKGLVLYEAKYNNPDGYYFARTKEDFDEHFVDERNCPIEFLLKEKLKKRIKFYDYNWVQQKSPVSTSILVAYGENNVDSILNSGIEGNMLYTKKN
jgi:hypothetical protein